MRVPPSWPKYLLKAPLSNIITLVFRISTCELFRNTKIKTTSHGNSYCICCSVAKLCPTPCDHRDWSTPAFPVLHYLLTVFSDSCPWCWWCHPSISSSISTFSFCPQSFPGSGSFPMSWLFTSGGQFLELQLQYQSFQWIFRIHSGLTGLISLLSKGLSRVL